MKHCVELTTCEIYEVIAALKVRIETIHSLGIDLYTDMGIEDSEIIEKLRKVLDESYE